MLFIPENCAVVEGASPQVSGAGAVTADYICLKNVHKAYIVVHMTQGNAATTVIQPIKATGDAVGNTNITAAARIWADEDCVASDALVKQTSATSFTTSAAVKHKIVIIEIDPAALGETYDWLSVSIGDSHADNIFDVMYYLDTRYPQATPPTAIA